MNQEAGFMILSVRAMSDNGKLLPVGLEESCQQFELGEFVRGGVRRLRLAIHEVGEVDQEASSFGVVI